MYMKNIVFIYDLQITIYTIIIPGAACSNMPMQLGEWIIYHIYRYIVMPEFAQYNFTRMIINTNIYKWYRKPHMSDENQ